MEETKNRGSPAPAAQAPSDSFFYDKQGSQRGLGRPRPIMGLPGGGRYDEAYFSDSGRESEGEEEGEPFPSGRCRCELVLRQGQPIWATGAVPPRAVD